MQEAESGIVASPKRSSHHKLACSAHSPTASRNMHSLVLRDLFSAPGLMERYFPIGLHISIAKFFFSMHFFLLFAPGCGSPRRAGMTVCFSLPCFFLLLSLLSVPPCWDHGQRVPGKTRTETWSREAWDIVARGEEGETCRCHAPRRRDLTNASRRVGSEWRQRQQVAGAQHVAGPTARPECPCRAKLSWKPAPQSPSPRMMPPTAWLSHDPSVLRWRRPLTGRASRDEKGPAVRPPRLHRVRGTAGMRNQLRPP